MSRTSQQYEQLDTTRIELESSNASASPNALTTFFQEISTVRADIAALSAHIDKISSLHSSSSPPGEALQEERAAARTLMWGVRKATLGLERENKEGGGWGAGDGRVRREQVAAVKEKFREVIQEHQGVEKRARQRERDRVERQIRIVNPDATVADVNAVLAAPDGAATIFQSALLNSSTRSSESRAALSEVQSRHADIQRIEKTITELQSLFNEMSIIVEEQGEVLETVHENTFSADRDVEAGAKVLGKATILARAARNKRSICLSIIVIVLIIVAIILAIQFSGNK